MDFSKNSARKTQPTYADSKIREDEKLGGTPVIFLTAKGMTLDRTEGYLAGVYDYISKPFDPDELAARVKNVINRQESINNNLHSNGQKYLINIEFDQFIFQLICVSIGIFGWLTGVVIICCTYTMAIANKSGDCRSREIIYLAIRSLDINWTMDNWIL